MGKMGFMHLATRAAGLVAILAVGIGVVGKTAPHLFMSVPNVGFILWAMTGNPMPPYFSPAAWQNGEHQSWLKDGDLVVSAGAKSGTTWMLFCTHQIRTKGSDAFNFTDVSLSTPWPDFIQTPGSSWTEQKPRMTSTVLKDGSAMKDYWDHKDYPFRIFKSHYGTADLPVAARPAVKFLAMTRAGPDVVASMVPFFDSHTEEFRAMMGGFPPPGTGDNQKDTAARIADLTPGGMLGEMYFAYVKEWWAMRERKQSNVLFLHYADAKKDIAAVVTQIAQFVGITLTPPEHAKVVERCGFPFMKKHTHMFTYSLPLNREAAADLRIMRNGAMTRKGTNGGGKVAMSPEQFSDWQKLEEEQFGSGSELLRWARNGGGSK